MNKELKYKLRFAAATGTAMSAFAAMSLLSTAVSAQADAARLHHSARALAASSALVTPSGTAKTLWVLHDQTTPLETALRDRASLGDIAALDYGMIDKAMRQSEDASCLARAVYYEARSETLAGQKAVAEVILNRVGSKHFPDTICGVVYQGSARKTGCQFSFTCDGSLDKSPRGKAWERSQTLATHMMIGAYRPMTARATHYHTTAIDPKWASKLKPTRTIGSHAFYKFKTRRELAASTQINAAP
ncbi:MAG: cell wall hydrolase [Robiginitomaculum sp.]